MSVAEAQAVERVESLFKERGNKTKPSLVWMT
jgi:hypothetical protein